MAKGKYEKWLEPEGLLLLEGWARDGLTDEQIAHNIGINLATLYRWKNEHCEICEALKKGKEVVDYAVENALLSAALEGNTTAQIFWLKNRRPDKWRDRPTLGQFTQQSMSPYTEQLRMFASLFAGETGLTLDDLGFVTDNPSSAEAIKASHENLRLAARKAQRTFGSNFLNAGYLAACVRDDFPYQRRQLYLTTAAWEPVFEPDAAMLSGIGDGVGKLNQAVPGYIGANNLRDLTGMASDA